MDAKRLINDLMFHAIEVGHLPTKKEADAIELHATSVIAEIEAAAVERFVKERFWNSKCEVSACVAESGMRWAENRRKEASK